VAGLSGGAPQLRQHRRQQPAQDRVGSSGPRSHSAVPGISLTRCVMNARRLPSSALFFGQAGSYSSALKLTATWALTNVKVARGGSVGTPGELTPVHAPIQAEKAGNANSFAALLQHFRPNDGDIGVLHTAEEIRQAVR